MANIVDSCMGHMILSLPSIGNKSMLNVVFNPNWFQI